MAEIPAPAAATDKPAESEEMSLEDVVSQLMVDNMSLKSLLVQKGVFSQDDFDAMAKAISDEILQGQGEPAPDAAKP